MAKKKSEKQLSFTVRLDGEHKERFLRYKEQQGLTSNAEVIRRLLKNLENIKSQTKINE